MIAHRQGGDEGGQGGTDQTGFAQQQIARAPRHRRQHADTGPGGGPNTAGTLERMIAVQHAGDPDAAGRALQVEHEVGAVTALAVPHLERRAARGTECRVMVLIALGLKRLAPPDPFAAALLAGFAPGAGWGFRCRR